MLQSSSFIYFCLDDFFFSEMGKINYFMQCHQLVFAEEQKAHANSRYFRKVVRPVLGQKAPCERKHTKAGLQHFFVEEDLCWIVQGWSDSGLFLGAASWSSSRSSDQQLR